MCPTRDLPAGGYLQRHVDIQLDHSQAQTLARVLTAVRGRELKSGRVVNSMPDAVRWIIEEIAD